ncbi:MAG TPA: histidine kinase dimerization/phospho-acceptor domain-containing protein, partial [Planctomycetota bacterium]|nr:histidine kinase dimerization/phospho-acceptor domain-containing protein [Planctomycetota bacterium]
MHVPWSVKAGIVGAALVAVSLFVYWGVRVPAIREHALARLDADLKGAAAALAAGLTKESIGDQALDGRVKAMGRLAGLRFTLVGEDGRVVADSDVPDPSQLANHAGRAEVRAALAEGSATSQRTSESVNRDLRYAAVRVAGTQAVARVALDAREVEALLAAETRLPWVAGTLATLVAAIVSGFLLAPTAAGVRRVAHALSGLERGDLAARVPVRGPDFLRGLSGAFNSMAERLEADVSRVTADRARLATVLDGMQEGVFAIDGDETVRFVNRAGRQLLGVDPGDEVEGRPLPFLVREPRILAIARAALSGGEPQEGDVVWDGTPRRLLHVRAAPVGGGGPGAILLVGDVSILRRLERMRSDFVGNVSHELSTPLSAISGSAELLLGGALSDPEAGPKFVSAIVRHADRLRVIVDDLLTLSRLESAPETIDRVPVDFAHVVRQSCEAVAGRAREGGLDLEVKAEGAARVLGDPEALRRLVDNLVVNALTYT